MRQLKIVTGTISSMTGRGFIHVNILRKGSKLKTLSLKVTGIIQPFAVKLGACSKIVHYSLIGPHVYGMVVQE